MTEYYMSEIRRVTTEQKDAIGKGKSCVELCKEDIKLHGDIDSDLSQKLPGIIYNYGLGVLLLGSDGQIKEVIDRDRALELIGTAKNISKLTEKEAQDLDDISSEVSNVCATALKISKDQKEMFNTLLQRYIVAELLRFGAENKRIFIRKSGKMLDYKLSRIMKYLGINVNLEKISDFAIEYNRQSVFVNGTECFTTVVPEEAKGPKTIRTIRK